MTNELQTVGAMHQCRAGEPYSTCVHCGALAEALNKPCPHFMRDAAQKLAAVASPTPQADSQPAPVRDYPPLPEPDLGMPWRVNAKSDGAAHSSGFTCEQMRAYVDADRAARAPADSQPAQVEVADAMADSQYLAGVSAGWNAANADDPNAALRKLHESRAGYLKPLSAARAPADSVTAPAGGVNWQDISTAPKDGTRFVAVGQNYGLDSETQHTCIAQWLAGCWVEVSDWNGASKLKYLTHWMPLPPLPGSAARAPADSVTAPVNEAVAYLDIGAGGYIDLGTDLSEEALSRLPKGRHALTIAGTYGIDGYTPTTSADSVLEDAARLDWLALAGPVSICVVIDRPHDGEVEVATDDVTGYGKTLREAIDAAMKKGGAA